MILSQSFYNRPTLQVAQDLLGCFLVKKNPEGKIRESRLQDFFYKIIETEAYVGPNDLASHASKGHTSRNSVMFGKPGIIYVYFTYGMHYMLNIVTEKQNYPAAVLIRAVEPINLNLKSKIAPSPKLWSVGDLNLKFNGPAKLTKSLQINKSFNGLPIYTKKHGLWIESPPTLKLRRASRNTEIKPSQIKKTTRIGVDYAKEYKNKKWRFYIKDNEFVSKK